MNKERQNKLCDEARTEGEKLIMMAGFALHSINDKEKLLGLKSVIKCINDLGKIKEQIENEISITKDDAIKELEGVRDCLIYTADCMGESLRRAILEKSNAEKSEYIDDAIYRFDLLEGHRIRLETLRERLNLEEEKNDNQ